MILTANRIQYFLQKRQPKVCFFKRLRDFQDLLAFA